MGRITNSKKIKLLRIEKARLELGRELETQFINDLDIMYILGKDVNYSTHKQRTGFKIAILKDIMSCPYILCDQKHLSQNIKAILPHMLFSRYNIEKDELDYYLENAYIGEEEYNKELDELKFCYFGTSKEGKKYYKNSIKK